MMSKMQDPYADMPTQKGRGGRRPRQPKPDQPPAPPKTPAKRGRKPKASAPTMEELYKQQQNAQMYGAPPHVPDLTANYSVPDPTMGHNYNKIGNSNQAMYYTMHTSPNTYSIPEQQQLQHLTEQPAGPRYNTRRSVHNLPLATAPTMQKYWNTNAQRPPVTSQSQTVQQMSTPAPVAHPYPVHKETFTQTELELTEKEIKCLLKFREKNWDAAKLCSVIEKGDYLVSFEENENKAKSKALKNIVKHSDKSKDDLMNVAYVVDLQQKLSVINQLAALGFKQAVDNSLLPIMGADSNGHPFPMLPPAFVLAALQPEEEEGDDRSESDGATAPELPYPDSMMMASGLGPIPLPMHESQAQPQMTPPRAEHLGFPITTLVSGDSNYFDNNNIGPQSTQNHNYPDASRTPAPESPDMQMQTLGMDPRYAAFCEQKRNLGQFELLGWPGAHPANVFPPPHPWS